MTSGAPFEDLAGTHAPTPGPPPTFPDDARFAHAPRIAAAGVEGGRLAGVLGDAAALSGLGRLVRFPGALERAECVARAPFLADAPYLVPPVRLWQLPRIRLINYPRVEGMAFTADGRMVRETRGSPRVVDGNDHIRLLGPEIYLNPAPDIAGRLPRAALCHDSASRNFAHFMMLMLPRIVLMDAACTDMPIIVPDMPDYAAVANVGMRHELLRDLATVLPLSKGNRYLPLRPGAWEVEELSLISIGMQRWDLVLHRAVGAAFSAIAAAALAARPADAPALPKRIYLSRQGASRRRVANHDAVEALLAGHGFTTILMETLGLDEQAALFAGAEAVVAPHGAGLANILFNDGRAGVLELYGEGDPQYHFALCATARGCRYVPLACRRTNKVRDVEVDLQLLARALDLLSA
jgi:capsular polysaccharide biosynthesis protein